MALLEKWQKMAYNENEDKNKLQKLWADYFEVEKGIYKQLLADPDTVVSGTVAELAEKYETDIMTMTGFLDGINDSLVTPNPIDTMGLTRKDFTRTWLPQTQTGSTDLKSGMTFSMPKNRASFTKSRNRARR